MARAFLGSGACSVLQHILWDLRLNILVKNRKILKLIRFQNDSVKLLRSSCFLICHFKKPLCHGFFGNFKTRLGGDAFAGI